MIVVFVVDTSPSMKKPASQTSGLSRLDIAKQVVEDLSKQLRKRHLEHHRMLQEQSQEVQRSMVSAGLGLMPQDSLLLLSTSRQYPNSGSCAAGGRLLVSFGDNAETKPTSPDAALQDLAGQTHLESFQYQLKRLKTTEWDTNEPFPEGGGGAIGLNAALSAGLQLLSRYRLQNRQTENFGMGRLPSVSLTTANGSPASAALQPACLVLLTDGECLNQPKQQGGGSLQLQFGSHPLREFYKEPFRWDQRIFCVGVGGTGGKTSSQFLHAQLRALCEVTGGSHWMLRRSGNIQHIAEGILRSLCPPLPAKLPLPDPLFLRLNAGAEEPNPAVRTKPGSAYVSGGPICSFQALEHDEAGRPPTVMRAMLLYTGSSATTSRNAGNSVLSPPLWCIPEAHFPGKKLDTLPPRSAQPLLMFSKYPANLGSKSFEAMQLIKMLHRLDQILTLNANMTSQQLKLLHRDTYVCEWLGQEGGKPMHFHASSRQEYFPVFVSGGKSLSEDGESYLNIGILHVPFSNSTLAGASDTTQLATLTLLPPEPHILLPLLIRVGEAVHRTLKKMEAKGTLDSSTNTTKLAVPLDESWRTEFAGYNFRIPPYYQHALRRCLRSVLPTAVHSFLHVDPIETVPLLCFSKACLQKIRNGEQVAKDHNERLERQETSLRRQLHLDNQSQLTIGYGQYDPRSSVESYLAALRCMPPPWKAGVGSDSNPSKPNVKHSTPDGKKPIDVEEKSEEKSSSSKSAVKVLGHLPVSCLMAYYESRRRWVFGGPGLTTRGLHVEGVNNGGSNSQRCDSVSTRSEPCLLSIAGVGVSKMNEVTTSKMGNFRERLLFSRSPIVGSGSNDYAGVAATTAVDGSPRWSVDDDAMPTAFFDQSTGEFVDSVQARMKSRLMVNFGNPFKEKRGDSLIPEKYRTQTPYNLREASDVGDPRTPPNSPPHDTFDSVEEGEAIFVRTSPTRSSPQRDDMEIEPDTPEESPTPGPKRARSGSIDRPPPPPPQKTPPPKPLNVRAQPKTGGVKVNPPKPHGVAAAAPSSSASPAKPHGAPPPPKPARGPPPPPPARPGGPQRRPSVAPKPKAPPPRPKPKPQSLVNTQPTPSTQTQTQTAVAESPKVAGGNGPSGPAISQEMLQQADIKPNVNLPAGWMCVWSKSQRRWYFFNTKNNQSVWEWPPPGGTG